MIPHCISDVAHCNFDGQSWWKQEIKEADNLGSS